MTPANTLHRWFSQRLGCSSSDYLFPHTDQHTLYKKELISVAKWIDVSVSKRQLKLFDGRRLLKVYRIGVGRILTPTPRGTYTIMNKQRNPGGPFGAFWMGLSKPHYGIHGTNDPNSIGKYVSHGCIRMHNRDVLELSTQVPIGTRVAIHR
ncbi:L,D-transpeptidase catalytic domain [Edaphobacillus lindanitolerans]|uniref:L,D-transpeptidase catalytic domain n=1 Tax=Edaphobacillus lindanitolerans TaxID=550447 RepID=A0A1U7PPE7_9BACI|nr:L,D-transpeptidase catalytic domain [Edaphobacillus lindanitolerans]